MTNAEIIMNEINLDLEMYKEWREKRFIVKDDTDLSYYRYAAKRSLHRAEAKCDLARAQGYAVKFDDKYENVVAVYPNEFDD